MRKCTCQTYQSQLYPTLKAVGASNRKLTPRVQLELHIHMQTESGNNHWAAIAVVSRVADVLHIRRYIHAPPEERRVIGFQDILPSALVQNCARGTAKPVEG